MFASIGFHKYEFQVIDVDFLGRGMKIPQYPLCNKMSPRKKSIFQETGENAFQAIR